MLSTRMAYLLHRYYGAGYLHFITTVVISGAPYSAAVQIATCFFRIEAGPPPLSFHSRWSRAKAGTVGWSSFRHYVGGDRGVVLVNEPREAEMRTGKIGGCHRPWCSPFENREG